MKKFVLLLIFALLAMTASAQVNLDFAINIEDKIYFPNEKVKVDISVINRDVSFAAKNSVLTLTIGDREYNFRLGDISAGQTFSKEITLPEFPPATHTIKGVLNYTGIFDEPVTIETYNSFEVRFPAIERYPRNVNVVGFNLPDKMIAGKTYDVSVVVKNEGSIGGNMLIEVASLEEFVDEEAFLGPGESKTINLKVNFKNTEVSLIEARVYALISGVRYLLVYSGKKAYLEPERIAKLSIDGVEFVDESDNQINQNDEVKLKIYIKNSGNYPASSVIGMLKSGTEKIEVLKTTVNYNLIQNGQSTVASDPFAIKTKDIQAGQYGLTLDVNYEDSENHSISLEIPLSASEGEEACAKDSDCKDSEVCQSSRCVPIECNKGYVKDHKCIKYECISDADCPGTECDLKLHICKSPQCASDFQCGDSEVCSDGKCKGAFILLFVPIGYGSDMKEFQAKAEKEFASFSQFVPTKEIPEGKQRLRAHYVDTSVCKDISCSDGCNDCQNAAIGCAKRSGLSGIANKIVALTPNSLVTYDSNKPIRLCGCAGGIPSLTSISLDSYSCEQTVSHEVGHSLGLYHIACEGSEGGACLGPNAIDCKDPNKETDIMSYCHPRDHYGPAAYNFFKSNVFRNYLGG